MRGLAAGAVLLSLLAAGLAVLGTLARREAPPAPGSGAYVTVDGVRVRYTQTGSGPDVLLIHGSPGSVEDWEPLVARLSTGCGSRPSTVQGTARATRLARRRRRRRTRTWRGP